MELCPVIASVADEVCEARLAALVPKPRVNLTRFHGVFAPNSKHRALVTPAKRGKGSKLKAPATAAALALGAFSPRISVIGGLMGMATFLITLSFTLGVPLWEEGYGFPFIGSLAQFLFKDAGLLAGCYAIAVFSARKAGLARA